SNPGSASLIANQDIRLPSEGWLKSNHTGFERFWVAWAAQPIRVLEELIQSGKDGPTGGIVYDPRQLDNARNFLTTQSTARPDMALDYEKKQLNLKTRSDVLAVSLSKR